jgi:hypothetical protein
VAPIEVAEMLPAILSQMGPESLEHVKRFAYTGQQRLNQMSGKPDAGEEADADSDEEDVPDLVSNFDEPSKDEANVAKTTDTATTNTPAAGNFYYLELFVLKILIIIHSIYLFIPETASKKDE